MSNITCFYTLDSLWALPVLTLWDEVFHIFLVLHPGILLTDVLDRIHLGWLAPFRASLVLT